MADFCQGCSEDLGIPNGLSGLLTKSEVEDNLVMQVICEGCGVTFVNNDGKCVDPACLRNHNIPRDQDTPYMKVIYGEFPKEKEYDSYNATKPELPIEDYEDDSTSWKDGVDPIE